MVRLKSWFNYRCRGAEPNATARSVWPNERSCASPLDFYQLRRRLDLVSSLRVVEPSSMTRTSGGLWLYSSGFLAGYYSVGFELGKFQLTRPQTAIRVTMERHPVDGTRKVVEGVRGSTTCRERSRVLTVHVQLQTAMSLAQSEYSSLEQTQSMGAGKLR